MKNLIWLAKVLNSIKNNDNFFYTTTLKTQYILFADIQ